MFDSIGVGLEYHAGAIGKPGENHHKLKFANKGAKIGSLYFTNGDQQDRLPGQAVLEKSFQ